MVWCSGSVLTAEAIACRDGLLLAKLVQAVHVHLDTDSEVLIELWQTRKYNRVVIWPVLNEIQELMGSFSSLSFKYVSRKANLAAHVTTKHASPAQPMCSWHSQAPAYVIPCIQHDIAVIPEI